MIFGTESEQYNTIISSLMSLTAIIMGESDYSNLKIANDELAPFFFFTFQLLVAYVLLNMLLAIIVDTYCDIKSRQHGNKSGKNWWSKLSDKCLPIKQNVFNKLLIKNQKRLKHKNVTVLDFYEQMKSMGYDLAKVVSDPIEFQRVFEAIEERKKAESDVHSHSEQSSTALNETVVESAESRLQKVIELVWAKERVKTFKDGDTICSKDDIRMLTQMCRCMEEFLLVLDAKINTLQKLVFLDD